MSICFDAFFQKRPQQKSRGEWNYPSGRILCAYFLKQLIPRMKKAQGLFVLEKALLHWAGDNF